MKEPFLQNKGSINPELCYFSILLWTTITPHFRVTEDPDLDDLEYRRVRIKGRYIYERQFAIGPRTRFDKGYKSGPKGIISDNDTTSHGTASSIQVDC